MLVHWKAILAGIAYFFFVFLKAFQQRNVAFLHYHLVIPISLLMSVCEVYIIWTISQVGLNFFTVLAVGLGSGLGAIAAMKIHSAFLGKGYDGSDKTEENL